MQQRKYTVEKDDILFDLELLTEVFERETSRAGDGLEVRFSNGQIFELSVAEKTHAEE